VATLDRHGLPGVESDAHTQGERGVGDRLVHEERLDVEGGTDGLPGRREHGQPLVPSELDQRSATRLNTLTDDDREIRRELGGRIVAALAREQRLATNFGDQEGLYLPPGVLVFAMMRGRFDHRVEL